MKSGLERAKQVLCEDLTWFQRGLERVGEGPFTEGDIRWLHDQLRVLVSRASDVLERYQELRMKLESEAPVAKGDLRLVQVAREEGISSAHFRQRRALHYLRAARKALWAARRLGEVMEPGSTAHSRSVFVRATEALREERGI